MKVLITGVAGFIGSSLCDDLLADGVEVVGLDNFDPYYDPAIKRSNIRAAEASSGFRLVEGDIRDRATVDRLVAETRPDAIVHLAARAGVRPSIENAPLYVDVNLDGTIHLLEACRSHGIPRFIFASSSSVYGARPAEPFSEDDPVDHPVSPYAATKKAGELLCHTYHHLHGLNVTSLRFFTVYGPRQRPEMAIHLFTRRIDREEEITVFGDGTARRDFTYISDIVQGLRAAISHSSGYRIYNLGGGNTVQVREVIASLEERMGRTARVRHLPAAPGDVPNTLADVSRARRELGYRPEFDFAEGLERFVDWYRAMRTALDTEGV